MPDTPTRPLHIGIVGCSAEGAALCYRTICAEGATALGAFGHPPVSMFTPSLASYVDCLNAGDLDGIAQLMLDSARRLVAAGADFLICPDNTIHQAFDRVEGHSPAPWLHIARVAAQTARSKGHRRIGILGTHWLTRSNVYPDAIQGQGLEWLRPNDSDIECVSRIIMDELTAGVVNPASTASLLAIIGRLEQAGCDAVALACTELPLAIDHSNSPIATLDSTRLLARAALARAISGEPPTHTSPPTVAVESIAHLAQRIGI